MEPIKFILENITIDKYYKLIGPAGIIFVIVGSFSNSINLISFGVLTFIYGIWAWMLGTVFHVKADIKTQPNKFSVYDLIVPTIIFFVIISFISYVYIAIKILS